MLIIFLGWMALAVEDVGAALFQSTRFPLELVGFYAVISRRILMAVQNIFSSESRRTYCEQRTDHVHCFYR